jgi:hypothetical protein
MNDTTNYDIIGDIHGRFDKLSALMDRMGYARDGDSFIPPAGHKALFLGDLIDPKPGHFLANGVRDTLRAVKAMCDRGDALCLMGNHELNAIYFHTADPNGRSGDPDRNWLRYRGSKNRAMHQGTLDDFENYDDPQSEWHRVWMPWMKGLPFYLDLGGLRAVHAAWHPEMIARIAGRSFDDEDFFLACSGKHTPEGEALETLLKGIEVELPGGVRFMDHTGASRGNIRARWWELPDSGIGYDGLVFPANPSIPADPVSEESFAQIPGYALDAPPVFIGHYFKPADSPLHPERHNVACIDHSAAKEGPLVAYRWKGGPSISPEHYIINL